jgi:hypothetical protein
MATKQANKGAASKSGADKGSTRSAEKNQKMDTGRDSGKKPMGGKL